MGCPIQAIARVGLLLLVAMKLPAVADAQEAKTAPAEKAGKNGAVRTEKRERAFGLTDYVSPEVHSDRRVTFRLHAPDAANVSVLSGDMTLPKGRLDLVKGDNGLWEATSSPIEPGAYRYHFLVDSAIAIDPDNTRVSLSNSRTYSVCIVPGSELFDERAVPHGAVAEIHYFSKNLNLDRRLHVYTPPDYPNGQSEYPVLYLLHGSSDSDDSWTSVGRANFILDNLIAAGKARPMLVVMPDGHNGPQVPYAKSIEERRASMKAMEREFADNIRPIIETRYKIANSPANRAIAGLSMGGLQTLHISLTNLSDYSYIGVFSSGAIGIVPFRDLAGDSHLFTDYPEILARTSGRDHLKLFWIGIGKDDFLLETSRKTVDALKQSGYPIEYLETDGAHRWTVWRDYLSTFVPRLFQQ